VLLSLSILSIIFCFVIKFSGWAGFKILEFLGKHALFFYVYHVAVLYINR
jgi:hypothetical protein